MMKIIVWVVLLAGVVTTFSSCEKDPEPIPAIVGTWSRSEYEFTELPSTFSYWEGATQPSLGETGYTFVFKADGTYTRNVSPGFSDKGTWTLDGTKLKLHPDDPDDLDVAEGTFVGAEFDVEGEISDIRLVLSKLEVFGLASNASIDAAGGNTNNVPDEEWVNVDVTLIYRFNKLN